MSKAIKSHYGISITKTLSALVITCALAAINTAPAAAQTATKLDCKDCIKSKQIENGKIKGKDLKDGAVGNDKLEDNAVDSSKIEDSSVSNLDLSGDSVTSDKIADGTVGTPDLAGSAVTGGKIATGAVNSSKVQNNSLTGADIAGNSVSVANLTNEAGADFDGGNQASTINNTQTIYRTVTVSAPTSGIVIVNASGHLFSLGNSIVSCSITKGTTIETAYEMVGEIDSTDTNWVPFGMTRGFTETSAGTKTYNLVCEQTLIVGDNASMRDSILTAMFFPTQY